MSNEIKKLDDGMLEFRLETGEVYKGDPMKILNEIGDSYISSKRWTQNIKAENENLKAQRYTPPEPPPAPAQPQNTDEVALQSYLLDQHAKALGYKTGAEYQADVQRIKNTSEQAANNQVAESFMLACPEFPSNDDAVNKLTGKVEQLGWNYDQQSLMAAHLLCVREGAYKPLTPDEINQTWANNMQVSSGTKPPPQPPGGNNPDGTQNNINPWQKSTDDLRKELLSQGGLGKALLDLKPGETFGG